MTKGAILKALNGSSYKFDKKPSISDLTIRLSKLVKQNSLEMKNGLFKITKSHLQKWLSTMEKTQKPEPPKVISKSKASMKKGATKKIQTKKNARKHDKRSAAKKSAAKKKAATKMRAVTKKRSQAKKASRTAKASDVKAKGETKRKTKKAQITKKVEAVKTVHTRSERMANRRPPVIPPWNIS